jgi:hypothetical protein
MAMHDCTRDEGGPFEVDRKLLRSKAVVVSVAETSGQRSRAAAACRSLSRPRVVHNVDSKPSRHDSIILQIICGEFCSKHRHGDIAGARHREDR